MIEAFLLIVGMFIMVKSAGIFVDQSASLAKKYKISDYVIGFTVVAFGTSLPELVSCVFSSMEGHSQLVVANIIGSNMANLCLIIGLIAVAQGYRIYKRDIDINIPINITAMMGVWGIAVWSNFTLTWSFGISLILFFLMLLLLSKNYNHFRHDEEKKYIKFNPWKLLGALLFLILSGRLVIDMIILMASNLGINESLLGYFILATGTSLPELVTTWMAVKRKEGEIGIGNILGSNMFNILFIMGTTSIISPLDISKNKTELLILSTTMLIVYYLAVAGNKYSFSRKEGMILLAIYLLLIAHQLGKSLSWY